MTKQPENIGSYQILGALGKGAMGQVYKAVQPSLNRIVALKVLPIEFLRDEERVERFNREAQAVALLNHPNVVQIIDKDRDGDILYFVMEYVPGASLDAVLSRRRLSLQETLTVFKGICRGLEAAHRQTIIHRDLNPRNVLVSDDFSVIKLADFGISRVENISREMGTLSTREVSFGSLHYMSPEQATDMSDMDHRADIYSAGVVLYEMLTGRVPVGRFSLPSQLNSESPPELDPIVLKCLATDPADRYATVNQLLKAVGAAEDQLRLGLVNELRGISRSTSNIFRKSTESFGKGRKMRLIAGAAVVLLLAVTGAGFFLARRGGNSDATEPVAPIEVAAVDPAIEVQGAPRFDADEAALDADVDLGQVEVPGDEGEATDETVAARPTPATRAPEPSAPPKGPEPAPPAASTPAPAGPSAKATGDLQVARDKFNAGLADPALVDLETFFEEYPESPLLPKAYMLKATILVKEGRIEEAQAALVEVVSRFGTDPAAADAQWRMARLTMQSGERDRELATRRILTELVASHPDSKWAPLALDEKAEIEIDRKLQGNDPDLGEQVPAALLSYRELTDHYPTHEASEEALWQLARIYEDLKRFDLAAAAYVNLGARFPRTEHDAWWEAGQVFDKKLDDSTRAIDAYRRVPESSNRHGAAQKRMKKLAE